VAVTVLAWRRARRRYDLPMSTERREDEGKLEAGEPPLLKQPSEPRNGPLARGTEPHRRIDAKSALADLESKLDRCLASIAMHFQPIVHARSRTRFAYEALLRSADKSLPHPGAILDAAERLEKIPALGRAVRANVAKVVAAAPAARGIVFVNLHLLDLFDKQLTSPFSPLSK